MAETRIKSDKYSGIYWKSIKRRDGKGDERLYYIVYRRPGSRKQFEERLGRSSEGWTELKASIERGKRMEGKQTNAEKREAETKDKLTGAQPLTFGRLWELYNNANSARACNKGDRYRYHNHLAKRLEQMKIADIHTSDIAAIRKSMEGKGLAAQTVKHGLGLVKRVLRYGVKLGLCSMPDNLIFEMPKVDNVKTENMTAEQLAAYWMALDEEPNQDAAALLRLALLTGIRRGALFGLMWDDIDFENAILTLRGVSAKKGKTEHIPLNEAALRVLTRMERTSDYVFPGKNGGQRKTFTRMARRVRERAGLPKDFRPLHGLRHTFASALASSGQVDLYTLQKLLTHESTAMTQRYAHLADEAMRRAAAVANALAGKNNGKD